MTISQECECWRALLGPACAECCKKYEVSVHGHFILVCNSCESKFLRYRPDLYEFCPTCRTHNSLNVQLLEPLLKEN